MNFQRVNVDFVDLAAVARTGVKGEPLTVGRPVGAPANAAYARFQTATFAAGQVENVMGIDAGLVGIVGDLAAIGRPGGVLVIGGGGR